MGKRKFPKSVDGFEGRAKTRELVRIRDKHTCQDCGLVRPTKAVQAFNSMIEGMKGKIKSLDIHHLNGLCGKKTYKYDHIEDIPNLITLCHPCHFNRPEHKSYTKGTKLSFKKAQEIRNEYAPIPGKSYSALAKKYGVCRWTIKNVIKARIWKTESPY